MYATVQFIDDVDAMNSSMGSVGVSSPSMEPQDASSSGSPSRKFSLRNMIANFRTPENAKKKRQSDTADDNDMSTGGSKTAELGSEMSKKLHVTGEDPLRFLSNGFQELLSCRQILKGSFPYAFYAFDETNDPDTDDMEALYSLMERSGLSDRHIQLSRRQAFETLQSELETYVEILSDICARKRLRASKAQIAQATKNAKSKRIELEEYISQTNMILMESRKDSAYGGSGKKSAGSSRSPGNNRASFGDMFRVSPTAGRSGRLRMRGMEALLEMDVPTMMNNPPDRQMAMAQLRNAESRIQRRRQERMERNRDLGAIPGTVTALAAASSSNNIPSSDHDRALLVESSTRRSSSNSSRRPPSNTRRGRSPRRSSRNRGGRDDESSSENDSDNSLGSRGNSNASIDNLRTDGAESDDGLTATEQLQLQFHEEEALNRAILLSLQSADIDADNNTEAGQNGSTDDEEVTFIPDEGSVEMITAMGFTREQAMDALRRKGGNVDRAIDFLIN